MLCPLLLVCSIVNARFLESYFPSVETRSLTNDRIPKYALGLVQNAEPNSFLTLVAIFLA
jgi:hypothetical protein